MGAVKIVTGYVEIPDHPRGATDYRALGADLMQAIDPHEAFVFDAPEFKVQDTWLARWLHGAANITHSIADNAAKNTMAYHCVQHQKLEFLSYAAEADQHADQPADVYVWIDYGIMHVPGVTAAVIQKYLEKAQDFAHVTMPGCWLRKPDVEPAHPCWRFCGGLIAVPRPLIRQFFKLSRSIALAQINRTLNVEWEVNTLARVELTDQVPILWYKADHNETMFTNAP